MSLEQQIRKKAKSALAIHDGVCKYSTKATPIPINEGYVKVSDVLASFEEHQNSLRDTLKKIQECRKGGCVIAPKKIVPCHNNTCELFYDVEEALVKLVDT